VDVNIGILGFAHGHVDSYLSQWRGNAAMGIAPKAGWDHDDVRLTQAARKHGVEPCSSPEALLARPDLQAVVIAAETSLHADLVEKAAAAGKAIVLQKPVAITLAEADRIVAAVQRARVPFTMAWQMRADPQNLRIRELLASGEFGKLFMVRRRHGLGTHLWKGFAETWHVNPRLNRDIWADDASHPVDFIHWLLGVPESVTAEIASLLDPRIPMDNGVAVFRYPNGPIAEVCCSFTCVAGENTTEVFAERGAIVQNYGDAPSSAPARPTGAVGLKWLLAGSAGWIDSGIPSPAGQGERIAGLAGPLAEFLHGRRPALATAEEGRTTLRMTLACYVSTREGRRVRLDDPAIERV
jgi:predicted dehydrogenase